MKALVRKLLPQSGIQISLTIKKMSDIPEMSVQSTLTESTLQEKDVSLSKTTVNALADVSNSTGPYSIPDIASRAQYSIVTLC